MLSKEGTQGKGRHILTDQGTQEEKTEGTEPKVHTRDRGGYTEEGKEEICLLSYVRNVNKSRGGTGTIASSLYTIANNTEQSFHVFYTGFLLPSPTLGEHFPALINLSLDYFLFGCLFLSNQPPKNWQK